jgi:DNA primase
MAFPANFLEEIRDRVSLAGIVGRHVRLARRGRDYVGLCPFHKEKTPSFNVVEDKKFYHCFGCGAHGDVIGFTMRISNLAFHDAVEMLAREAGLEVPVETPRERERAEHAANLHDVCEAACQWFERHLASIAGERPRQYLRARGVSADLIRRFRLGYAPASGNGLAAELAAKFPAALAEEAGLVRKEAESGRRYDFFRDRVIFPILDRRDRVIAFGGRTLGDAQPKYLNSPDTPIFQKGLNLYGLNLARRKPADAPLLVVEGYMDVIALHGAGFQGAVAPLGTAVTEHQIAEAWRLNPDPILCFDGDSAGRRAADRALDRFLPLVNAERTLRFVTLPEGDDPDTLVQKLGRAGFAHFLETARPLSQFLWEAATLNKSFTNPERLIELEQSLRRRVLRIEDRATQKFYLQFVNDQIWDIRQRERRRGGRKGPGPSSQALGQTVRARAGDTEAEDNKLVLVAAAINHPWAARRDIDRFVRVQPRRRDLADLHHMLLRVLAENREGEPQEVKDLLQASGFAGVLERLYAAKIVAAHPFARPIAATDTVTQGWNAAMSRIQLPELKAQLDEAVARLGADARTEDWDRLVLLRQIYEEQNIEAHLMRDMAEEVERTGEWRPGGNVDTPAGNLGSDGGTAA